MKKKVYNHIISKFYLKGFSINIKNKGEGCYIYDFINKEIDFRGTKNIGGEDNIFNILSIKDGKEIYSNELENSFMTYEANAGRIIKEIIEGFGKYMNNKNNNLYLINEIDKLTLSNFIGMQYFRSFIASDQFPNKLKSKTSAETFNKFIKDCGLLDLSKKNFSFFYIKNKKRSYITGDFPIYRFNRKNLDNGFLCEYTQVIFPISSKICLVIDGKYGITQNKIESHCEIIKETNGMMLSNSSKFIISDNKKLLERMIESKANSQIPKNKFLSNKKIKKGKH